MSVSTGLSLPTEQFMGKTAS